MPVDIYNRIFIFSKEQMKRKKEIEGKNAKFGTVVVKGSSKTYTEIVRKLNPSLPSDYQIVTSGDIRKIKYFPPKGDEE
jgi:hypothetical protein